MSRQARDFVIIASAVIIAFGLILFFAVYEMGSAAAAAGVAFGAGVSFLELDSTALILDQLLKAKRRAVWAAFLLVKSLTIFGVVGILLWFLQISGIGFIIGFSSLVLGLLVAGAYTEFRARGGER
jgi:hypothetical protein